MTSSSSRSPSQKAVSASASRSNSMPPSSTEEAPFPQGQCRYILMIPELKGQRCGCVTFSHNPSLPGAMCSCGHLACYHLQNNDTASPGKNKDEIEQLKARIGLLEQQSDDGDGGAMDRVVSRVSCLEDGVDKAREEFHAEIKASYRNMSGAWQLIEQFQKQIATLEEVCRTQSRQLDRAGKELDDMRNRLLELLDSDESLEERIEKLETAEVLLSPPLEEQTDIANVGHGPRALSSSLVGDLELPDSPPDLALDRGKAPEASLEHDYPSTTWTLHVSLLPFREQCRPFDKDSTAYKRSLSRGLQRMVAIDAARGESFAAAVTRAFRHVLQGRPWELLRKDTDSNRDGGIKLQPFSTPVSTQTITPAFLREHCASSDLRGIMEAVYIAPKHGAMPWSQIRQLPVHVEGLESSWAYDSSVDHESPSMKNDARPSPHQSPAPSSVGSAQSNPLKRPMADLPRSACITSMSTAENEQGRAKIARTCMTAMVGVTTGLERRRVV